MYYTIAVYFMNYKKTISLLLFALSLMNVSGQFKYSPPKKDSIVYKRLRLSESKTKNNTNTNYRTSNAISFNYDLDLKNAAEADSNIKVVFVRSEELRKKSLKNLRNALISIGISIIAINNAIMLVDRRYLFKFLDKNNLCFFFEFLLTLTNTFNVFLLIKYIFYKMIY